MPAYPTRMLADVLARLRVSPQLCAARPALLASRTALDGKLQAAVVAEIPAFSETRNPQVLPGLARHVPEHSMEILRLLAGGTIGDFDFVQTHAQRRADQHFPLESILHAYRCGLRVISRWLREAIRDAAGSSQQAQQAIADVADFAIEYTDVISTVAASAYVAQTRLLAKVAGDQRSDLLNILLGGFDESDGRVAGILRDAGYLDRRQAFCVVLAEPVEPAEMLNRERARRLAESVDKLLGGSSARRLVDIRDNKVTTVFSDTRRVSGWTAPYTTLASRLAAELAVLGNAVLVGISNDVPSTSQIPTAYREARLALEFATVGNRVMRFADLSTRSLLLHLAGAALQHVLPPWSAEFRAADDKATGTLGNTLRAYAQADMNVLRAAERLTVHPNTVYARLQRIQDITGLDARSFDALTEMLIVVDCAVRR